MKINNLLKMFTGALVMTFIISSCADDFTEEDLLQAQYDLAQQQQDREEARQDSIVNAEREAQVAALNQAGQLLDFSVTVATDEAGVEGVTISATNQSGETASATTDASGNITFTDIQMGGHTIKMTSADHVDISFEIDFGVPERGTHYEIIDGQVIPIETSESARITAIPLSGMLTSTVKGKVTFESEVTNNAPEIPQGVTIRANLTNANNIVSTTNNNASFSGSNSGATNITFTQANIGSADVDGTSGDYVMTLPAVPGLGLSYDFLVPNLEADATVAYSSTDGGQTMVDGGVALGTFPAVFGESTATTGGSNAVYNAAYGNLKAVYSEPAAEGAGFSLDILGTFARGLSTETFGDNGSPVETVASDNMRVRLTPGAGYQSSPVASIPMGGNSGATDSATAEVGMEWKNTGATSASIGINDAGEGYVVGDIITLQITRVDKNGNDFDLLYNDLDGEVTAVDGDGGITSVDWDPLPTGDFWTTWDDLGTDEVANLRGFEVSFNGTTDAVFSLAYAGRVNDIDFLVAGNGYEEIPTITLTGGDASTAATVVIEEMAFQYQWAPNSTTITTPYVLLPEAVTFVGSDINDDNTSSTGTGYTDGMLGSFITGAATVQGHLRVDANGDIVVDTDDYGTLVAGVTDNFYISEPNVVVENAKHEQAFAPVTINGDGEFTGLNLLAAGAVPGTGYKEPVTLTLQNLDGSAASDVSFTLTGFSPIDDTQEVKWDGSIVVTSGGSGFTDDINNNGALVPNNLPVAIGTPENGTTIIRNINYGPGFLLDERVQ